MPSFIFKCCSIVFLFFWSPSKALSNCRQYNVLSKHNFNQMFHYYSVVAVRVNKYMFCLKGNNYILLWALLNNRHKAVSVVNVEVNWSWNVPVAKTFLVKI